MLLRIVGNNKKTQVCDVGPAIATDLVEHDLIVLCVKCKTFHPGDGVTWLKLKNHIKALMN